MSEVPSKALNHSNGARRRWLTRLGVLTVATLLLYGLYWLVYARHFVSTDDAYVGGNVVAITSRESAAVLALHADNTQKVDRRQLLIEFDPIRAKAVMDEAEAELARTIRSVRTDFAKVDALRAQLEAARINLEQAKNDYARRQKAAAAVSSEELAHARDGVTAAQAALDVAQSALAQGLAAVQGTDVANNPNVLASIAQLRQAANALSHMRLYAPVSGVVAQRTVQVGQQVAAGTPLMAVVPLDNVWVDANFKEGQLGRMRVGQPVKVEADIYGGSVTYHGKVMGLGAGSGSVFALLPPQNASGNWIKIVQRVPVRITLDPKEVADHPLRLGLSVAVSVDVAEISGPTVASTTVGSEMRGDSGDQDVAAVDQLIRRILSQNGA